MEKEIIRKFKCIKPINNLFNIGDIVYLLQDNHTIYNYNTKSAVYNHSEYLNNPEYFEAYCALETSTNTKIATTDSLKQSLVNPYASSTSISATINELNHNNIKHPSHYMSHPSGIECIEIAKYHDFCIGSAIKYLWRAGLKTEDGKSTKEKEIEDLQKAITFIQFKIDMLTKEV